MQLNNASTSDTFFIFWFSPSECFLFSFTTHNTAHAILSRRNVGQTHTNLSSFFIQCNCVLRRRWALTAIIFFRLSELLCQTKAMTLVYHGFGDSSLSLSHLCVETKIIAKYLYVEHGWYSGARFVHNKCFSDLYFTWNSSYNLYQRLISSLSVGML